MRRTITAAMALTLALWLPAAAQEQEALLVEKCGGCSAEAGAGLRNSLPQAAGDWVVLTNIPGEGQAYGRLSVIGEGSPYQISGELRLADRTPLTVSGSVNLASGFEWRANLDIGGEAYRQMLVISEDGSRLEGWQFRRDVAGTSGRLTGVRADGPTTILGVVPGNAELGMAVVQLVGTGLDTLSAHGAELGAVSRNDSGATVELSADTVATVRLSSGEARAQFVFYTDTDRIGAEPASR